ncbi:MAG TPA: thiamine pyrophosphate-dependent enzyme [Verrucomicrobiae bacterium]|jgi:indolepyruvate decarboxylase
MKPSNHIGEYLIRRLYDYGVRHVFGIPGDYVLGFYDVLQRSALKTINTCDEQGAGFAADAYARVRGMGAVCITYCVGGLKVANTTAEAFAEKSPVVIISGAPGMREREKNPLLHHKVREFDTQKKVFEQLTVASAVLSDPQTALQEIDRVLHACSRYKRPVYLELPRDMIHVPGIPHHRPTSIHEISNLKTLRASVDDARAFINSAKKPVILADVEVHRFGLQDLLTEFAEKTNIPVASTLLGKSVIGEQHPYYLGVYEGAMGREEVRRFVESSDCVIMLGTFMTDINLGVFTARLDPGRSISATSEKLTIRYHSYEDVRFKDFVKALVQAKWPARRLPKFTSPGAIAAAKSKTRTGELSVQKLFQRLNGFLTEDMVVVADVGDALFGAADLYIRHRTEFLGPAYYASMGFAIPAGIGAQFANRKLRPLILVGDGAFQMTGMELATAARYGLNPIVILLNNNGYGTERHMQDGPYNDVWNWRYHRFPEVIGAGKGFLVRTESELEAALTQAKQQTETFCLIEVQLKKLDRSPALQRLAERLARNI